MCRKSLELKYTQSCYKFVSHFLLQIGFIKFIYLHLVFYSNLKVIVLKTN